MSTSSKSSEDTKSSASDIPSSSTTLLGTATAVLTGKAVIPTTTDITLNHKRLSSTTNSSRPATTNGYSEPPNRASPVPNQANIPNGKPTSPLVATSNTMTNGGMQAPQTVSSKDPKAAAQAASDMRNIVRRKLTGYVGFANLPNQWHRKSVRKGFNFNVMVVGE